RHGPSSNSELVSICPPDNPHPGDRLLSIATVTLINTYQPSTMNQTTIKLILLDFDDTLVMTEEACFRLENEIAHQLGLAPMSRQTHQQNWGKPIAQAIAERLPGVDVDAFID